MRRMRGVNYVVVSMRTGLDVVKLQAEANIKDEVVRSKDAHLQASSATVMQPKKSMGQAVLLEHVSSHAFLSNMLS
jgi:hypothetical protein